MVYEIKVKVTTFETHFIEADTPEDAKSVLIDALKEGALAALVHQEISEEEDWEIHRRLARPLHHLPLRKSKSV